MDDTKKTLSLRLMELERKSLLPPFSDHAAYRYNCLGHENYCPCPDHIFYNDIRVALETLIRRIETNATA